MCRLLQSKNYNPEKIIAALLLILPSLALDDYMDGFYIAIKGGVSNTRNAGLTTFVTSRTLVIFKFR